MPTHASNRQKAQNLRCSPCWLFPFPTLTQAANVTADAAHTREDNCACSDNEESPCEESDATEDERACFCRTGDGRNQCAVMYVYNCDPSIIETMKAEKMYPNGRDGSMDDSCNVGTQMKTKRYIEPSKIVCVKPRTRRMGSITGVSLNEWVKQVVRTHHSQQSSMPLPIAGSGKRLRKGAHHLCPHRHRSFRTSFRKLQSRPG
jgi:hypothetical protein